MKTVTLPLNKLIAYAGNPRKNDHAVEAVASAIKRFGFRVPVLAKSDGSLIDGHLRVKAAKHLGMEEVPVVLCDDLSEADIKALRISINRMAELAEWDNELLAGELQGLSDLGINPESVGFNQEYLSGLLNGENPEENAYTRRIETPCYEITGTKPEPKELCDSTKSEKLISEINKAKLPPEVAEFLIHAAHRHTVFDFGKVAEFYAHADEPTQRLMEKSALVIVDFKQAVEQGFVELSENIRLSYLQDIDNEK
jgi:hypothetical protein